MAKFNAKDYCVEIQVRAEDLDFDRAKGMYYSFSPSPAYGGDIVRWFSIEDGDYIFDREKKGEGCGYITPFAAEIQVYRCVHR